MGSWSEGGTGRLGLARAKFGLKCLRAMNDRLSQVL